MALDVKVGTDELRFLLEAGYLATERREHAKAKEIFEGVIALGRGVEVAEGGLANVHLREDNVKEAEKLLKQSVKKNPENAYAQALLGEVLHVQQKKEEALEALGKARTAGGGRATAMAGALEEAVKTGVAYKYKAPAKTGAKKGK